MSDKIKGLTVVLEPNMGNEAADRIADAMNMIKGVHSVKQHVADFDHHCAVEAARQAMGSKILEVVFPQKDQK